MSMQTPARQLICTTAFLAILCTTMPVSAVPLTGAGPNLPIPAVNPSWPPGQSVSRVNLGGAFTGTWMAPVQSDWVGTFNATGPIPSSMGAGSVKYDFSSLPLGYLPSGTFFIFGDIDRGSLLAERCDLKGFDSSGNLIATPWLDETYAVRGPGTGVAGAVQSNDMPSWSWDDPALPLTYVINGSSVTGGNPNVAFALVSNQPVHAMELDKLTTHYGFVLAAPVIPEPSTLVIASLGTLLLISRQRTSPGIQTRTAGYFEKRR